ncbi:hypothetical protein DVH24_042740 [Malus domestica]|uniref:ADP/ATP translocase n=1 Tax=Malus domestica TaxID=3750 RepID=A0A498I4B6_MALDO|nr:hypothetical protein DVH24_042740 [Malus domestica]
MPRLPRRVVESCVGIIVYRGLYFGMYDSLKPVVLTVKYGSSLDAFKQNIKNEGAKSLFKGARANILRAVASANVVAGYDKLQVLIIPLNWSREQFKVEEPHPEVRQGEQMRAQMMAQSDQMRAQLRAQGEEMRNYAGTVRDLVQTIQMSGLQISLPPPHLAPSSEPPCLADTQ